jgi:hypothetical protein
MVKGLIGRAKQVVFGEKTALQTFAGKGIFF